MRLKKLGKSWRTALYTFIFGATMLSTMNVVAQDGTVTLPSREISVRQSISELQSQTGYNVIVDAATVNLDKKVLLSGTQLSTRALLSQLLSGTHCTYSVSGEDIIISGSGNVMPVAVVSGPQATQTAVATSAPLMRTVAVTPTPTQPTSAPINGRANGITSAAPTVAGTILSSLADVNAEAVMFNFRVNKTDLERDYMGNRQMFAILNALLADREKMALIDYITITASASPEGYTDKNMKLSQGRANAMKGYLVWKNIPLSQERIVTYPIGEDWDGLRKMVVEDTNTPNRDAVLKILDNRELNSDAKRAELHKLTNAYSYIKSKMLPYLRGVGACIIYFKQNAGDPETPRSIIDQREALRREIANSTPGVNSGVGVKVLPAPENVAARVSSQNGNAIVSWDPVVGATGYRYQIGNDNSTPIYTTATSINVPRNADGTVPNVRVTAVAPQQLGVADSPYSNWTAIALRELPAPKNLAIAAETPTTARVTWEPVAGAIGYAYQVGGDNSKVMYTTNPYANIARNSDGSTPKVHVMAVAPSNSDTKSSPYTGWVNLDANSNVLPVPQNVKTAAGTTPSSEVVSWDPVPGAKGYYVKIGDDNSEPIYTTDPRAVVQKNADGTSPTIRVQAVPSDQNALPSAYTTWVDSSKKILPTPQNIEARSTTPTTAVVGWSPVANARGYYVQFGDETTAPVFTATPSIVLPKNADGTTPKIRVMAVSDPTTEWLDSQYSNWKDIDQGMLPTPEHLASRGTNGQTTTVGWDPVKGAQGYYVQVANENSEPIYVTDPTAVIQTQDGKTPSIRVMAVAPDNTSIENSDYTPWMNVDELPVPVNIAKYTTTPDQRRSNIGWSPVQGAAGYLVQTTDEKQQPIYVTNNTATINNDLDGTTPLVRVKAIAPEGSTTLNSEWSGWKDLNSTFGSRVDTVYIYKYGEGYEDLDPNRKVHYYALKTNLLYDAVLLPDLFVEMSLGHRWSLSVGGQWSWWNTEDNNRWFHRIQLGTVELRKWLGSSKNHTTLNGWYIGAYGTYGTYDLNFEHLFGITSHGYLSNETWSAGLSLGYSTRIARRWNLDFGVAVGYVKGDYQYYVNQRETDCYHHYPAGDGTINGIYPTRAQISLVYLIGSGVNKTKNNK